MIVRILGEGQFELQENQIASLDLKQTGSEVRVAVIDEPKVPTGPAFPQLKLVVLVPLLGGIMRDSQRGFEAMASAVKARVEALGAET